jgi:hypothetical protein
MTEEKSLVSITEGAMMPDELKAQVQVIQHAMAAVMTKGQHYGTIPGCGDKPTLLKPGAEKICATFRLAPAYEIQKTSSEGGHREYEITCTLTHINSGLVFGQGVGCCSTMEGKYRFRNAGRVCPDCGLEDTIIKGKDEYGGGWLCFARKGGCGAKFKDGDQTIESQQPGKVDHDNPADYYNTVLKMAKKRAHVDAVLTVTAASDIFTQDIEDMPEVIPGATKQQTPPPTPDPAKTTKAPSVEESAKLYHEMYLEINECTEATTMAKWFADNAKRIAAGLNDDDKVRLRGLYTEYSEIFKKEQNR